MKLGVMMRDRASGLVSRSMDVVLPPRSSRSRFVAEVGDRAVGQMHRWSDDWRGVSHHLRHGGPDADVDDLVLADRVRSMIGGLEHRLDMPRVHVMVEGGVVKLHGDVPGWTEESTLLAAIGRVPGVMGVESHLHRGLIKSDTRPSEAVH
jgi:osmotically-inducible protein OsmY